MTLLEKNYITAIRDRKYRIYQYYREKEQIEEAEMYWREWLAISSLLTGLEDKDQMKETSRKEEERRKRISRKG